MQGNSNIKFIVFSLTAAACSVLLPIAGFQKLPRPYNIRGLEL